MCKVVKFVDGIDIIDILFEGSYESCLRFFREECDHSDFNIRIVDSRGVRV